jgi:molybdopterin-containing oxidoreductase family membrane subunit
MQGVVAVFHHMDAVIDAAKALKAKKIGDVTVYSPTIHHEIEDALEEPVSAVRRFTLVGGLLGWTFGYWISIWASEYWPLQVGGKAIASWVPYTIIGFEMFVMCGCLSTVFGMMILSRIPRLVLNFGYDTRFTYGDYGIWVEATPDKFGEIESMMKKHGAVEVRGER